MKFLFELLLVGGFKKVLDLIIHVIKSHCLVMYIEVIERFRGFFIRGLVAFVSIMLMITGFLIIHVAIFLYLPWEIETKALILLILGMVYFIVPLSLVFWLYSKAQWMKISGVEEMIENLSEAKKNTK